MRKLKAIIIMFLLLAFTSPSFASVGYKVDGSPLGAVTDLNFRSLGTAGTFDGSTLTFNLILAGTGNGGATSMTTTDTAVSTSYAISRKAIGVQVGLAGTLADGYPGQILTIFITTVAGSGTYVLTPTTKTGFTTLTFDAAKDQATLLFVNSTVGWILLSNTAVTVAIP